MLTCSSPLPSQSCTQLVGYPKNKGESWNNIVTEANSRQSATYIKVVMGDTTDYWMPKTGKTIGQMIMSDCDGMWSPDKKNWQAPECMGYLLLLKVIFYFERTFLTGKYMKIHLREHFSQKLLRSWVLV